MKTLQEFLEEQFDQEMMLAVLSGQRQKGDDIPSKVRIRPVEIRGTVCYQATAAVGQKAIHKNYTLEEVIIYVRDCLENGFSQLQIQGQHRDASVLISKKGRQTMKTKQHPPMEPVKIMAHNRVKQYILQEGIPVPFLVDLGVMSEQGKVHQSSYDKFKQINRFLEFIEDILPALSREREITILDFGCGSGWDTRAFLSDGFRVEALDGSEELCRIAEQYCGIPVRQMHFQDFSEKNRYDGIWACASILHLSMEELEAVFLKMADALRFHGIIYASFKYGEFEGERNGRYFTDMTERRLEELLKSVPHLRLEEAWLTTDVRPGRDAEKWLNVILRKA